MDIKELYDKVSNGSKFYVNFKERTVRVDKQVYSISDIEYGRDMPNVSERDFMDVLYSTYEVYKHSVPSESGIFWYVTCYNPDRVQWYVDDLRKKYPKEKIYVKDMRTRNVEER